MTAVLVVRLRRDVIWVEGIKPPWRVAIIRDSGSFTRPVNVTVIPDEPIQRGDTSITEIQLRKPKAGELRGVSLVDVANLDVMALQKVLPRITQPLQQFLGRTDLLQMAV